jgi:hypothetical protein
MCQGQKHQKREENLTQVHNRKVHKSYQLRESAHYFHHKQGGRDVLMYVRAVLG